MPINTIDRPSKGQQWRWKRTMIMMAGTANDGDIKLLMKEDKNKMHIPASISSCCFAKQWILCFSIISWLPLCKSVPGPLVAFLFNFFNTLSKNWLLARCTQGKYSSQIPHFSFASLTLFPRFHFSDNQTKENVGNGLWANMVFPLARKATKKIFGNPSNLIFPNMKI